MKAEAQSNTKQQNIDQTGQNDTSFNVWLRIKPYRKYQFSQKMLESMNNDPIKGRPLWESCINIQSNKNKLTNEEIQLRNNDFKAVFYSDNEILFK